MNFLGFSFVTKNVAKNVSALIQNINYQDRKLLVENLLKNFSSVTKIYLTRFKP